VVAALAHAPRIYEFAAASSDLVFITPTDDASLRAILGELHVAGGARLKVFADVVVTFGGDADFGSDALIFGGRPQELVELLLVGNSWASMVRGCALLSMPPTFR
jgi:hypothetical protein